MGGGNGSPGSGQPGMPSAGRLAGGEDRRVVAVDRVGDRLLGRIVRGRPSGGGIGAAAAFSVSSRSRMPWVFRLLITLPGGVSPFSHSIQSARSLRGVGRRSVHGRRLPAGLGSTAPAGSATPGGVPRRLVLASASPARLGVLRAAGLRARGDRERRRRGRRHRADPRGRPGRWPSARPRRWPSGLDGERRPRGRLRLGARRRRRHPRQARVGRRGPGLVGVGRRADRGRCTPATA